MRRRAAPLENARGIDWGGVWTWAFCFGLPVYLGLEGGGYDPLVHDQAGIAVWWVLLAGVLVGAMPRLRPSPLAWLALALLAAFVLWTAASLGWTESLDRTTADVARIGGYLGVFGLALFSRGRRESRRVLAAVAAAIVVVAGVGLLSRLHPAWFPAAGETGRFVTDRERLSYPIDYWNGLAGVIAIGLPLLLYLATAARSALARALAGAALPAMLLTIFLTLSRGGIAAAVLVVAVFFLLSADRLPKLLVLLVTGAGGAALIAAADSRNALQHGLSNAAAHSQGSELLWIVVLVCVVAGVVVAALTGARAAASRPSWTRISKRRSGQAALGAVAVLLVAALALGAPHRIANGWDEFKQGGGAGSGAGRLGSVAGQSRYQLWSAAVRENATKPLIGTGSGTFEFWWARDGNTDETVRDTHSLYLQTLGELGIVGLIVLVAFLVIVLVAAGRRLIAAGAEARASLAAALAGFLAFCITSVFDWMWQIPVLPVLMLLLASVLLIDREAAPPGEGSRIRRLPLRLALALAAIVAIVAIAIPLASTSLVRQSEADARAGDLAAALKEARSAQNVQPYAATPRLQQALVLEAQGRFGQAAEAARAATEREKTDWRNWLVLSRIEAENGEARAAVRDYVRAKSLNPRSTLFRG